MSLIVGGDITKCLKPRGPSSSRPTEYSATVKTYVVAKDGNVGTNEKGYEHFNTFIRKKLGPTEFLQISS